MGNYPGHASIAGVGRDSDASQVPLPRPNLANITGSMDELLVQLSSNLTRLVQCTNRISGNGPEQGALMERDVGNTKQLPPESVIDSLIRQRNLLNDLCVAVGDQCSRLEGGLG